MQHQCNIERRFGVSTVASMQLIIVALVSSVLFWILQRLVSRCFLAKSNSFKKWNLSCEKKRAWGKNRAFFTHVAGSYVIFWNKRNFYVRKRFDSHQTGLEHQHCRYFIVLGLQYGGRDMWKRSTVNDLIKQGVSI